MVQSLERMVKDLGRDYYHLSGPALDALGEKVKHGDMEEVLRVYEKELQVRRERLVGICSSSQSPLKNAVLGSLIRTLLIQVQKTKVSSCSACLNTPRLIGRPTFRCRSCLSTTSSGLSSSHSPSSASHRLSSSCTRSAAGFAMFGEARNAVGRGDGNISMA